MSRFILPLILLVVAASQSADAAEAVAEAQRRLKAEGYYYGAIDGGFGDATEAAITRYQIRHGLEINGQLDAETRKALDVSPGSADSRHAPGERAPWEMLRKKDEQFLERIAEPAAQQTPARPAPTPAATPAAPKPTVPKPAPPPPRSDPPAPRRAERAPESERHERLRDYVAAFVLAGLEQSGEAEIGFFADRVRYFDQGMVDRDQIGRDLRRYNQRYPHRRFRLAGELDVERLRDGETDVTFPLRYSVSDGKNTKSGTVRKTLRLRERRGDWEITAVSEKRAR